MAKIIVLLTLIFTYSNSFALTLDNDYFFLERVEFSQLNGWDNDNLIQALKVFNQSCETVLKSDSYKIISAPLSIKNGDLFSICKKAKKLNVISSQEVARRFFENNFLPFSVVDKKNGNYGKFTGYYEASINGSRTKTEKYKYPIYGRPPEFDGKCEYHSRREIESGILNGRGLELFYTDNKVDLFFLQVQGSGIIKLTDGTIEKLTFDAKNNLKYNSIGSALIENGHMRLEDVNAISIRKWLNSNPDKIDDILNRNESYVFFRIGEKSNFIKGAHNSSLIPYRSMAVDKDLIPLGFPFWLETKVMDNNKELHFLRMMISQDTGSAIKGSVRGDIFFGNGKRAEELASYMNHSGKYFILIPKNILK